MARKSVYSAGRAPRILLASSDREVTASITQWCQDEDVKIVGVESCREAMNLLHDIVFIESALDGLLVDAELCDGSGFRVIREYRHEFPDLPTALIGDAQADVSLGMWSKSKQIPILRRPADQAAILGWLSTFRARHATPNAKMFLNGTIKWTPAFGRSSN
jgi:hypothetical protein